jgi:hypothetical protein
VWNDIEDIQEFPPHTDHAVTDNLILSASSTKLGTAIVAPPFVMGSSPSRRHPAPSIMPDLMHVIRYKGKCFIVGDGLNEISFVDVYQLAKLYCRLVQDAIESLEGRRDEKRLGAQERRQHIWGPKAYFFPPRFVTMKANDFVKVIGMVLSEYHPRFLDLPRDQTQLDSSEVAKLSAQELTQIIAIRHHGTSGDVWSRGIAQGFGANTKIRGERASKYLYCKEEPSHAEHEFDMFVESVAVFMSLQSTFLPL